MTRPITVDLISAVAMAAVLAACSGGTNRSSGGPAPEQTPYRTGPIRMGHWGIGPIRADTYFERDVIHHLFPKARVKDVMLRVTPDETLDAIVVKQGATEMLEIDDGDATAPGTDDPLIGKVRALNGPVVGPRGESLGMSWAAAGFDLSACEIGVGRDRNTVICARRGEGAITYYFTVPGWDSEEVPAESLMRKGAYLKEMVWSPPPLPAPSSAAPAKPHAS